MLKDNEIFIGFVERLLLDGPMGSEAMLDTVISMLIEITDAKENKT